MNQGIQNMCNALRNPKYKQIKGTLIMYKNANPNEIIGKCALGEIACQVGMDRTVTMGLATDEYDQILHAAGVPTWLTDRILPDWTSHHANELGQQSGPCHSGCCKDIPCNQVSLSTYIYYMNDTGWKYKEIADFLETTFGDIEDE